MIKSLVGLKKVEKNEKDDRVLYNLGHEMANSYSNKQITTDILKDYLIKGTNEANQIRQEK